jgi:hypothetical protein
MTYSRFYEQRVKFFGVQGDFPVLLLLIAKSQRQ